MAKVMNLLGGGKDFYEEGDGSDRQVQQGEKEILFCRKSDGTKIPSASTSRMCHQVQNR
jgi:hypothetical protein